MLINIIDTILFDYGGVVGTHRVEPYWGRYAALLESDPQKANKYIAETSPHGIAFRLGKITMEEFWEEVQKLAGVKGKNPRELMDNWAKSYAIDPRMLELSKKLRKRGYKTGILMNSDIERYKYIQKTYHLNNYYDYIISSNIHKVIKPDPAAYTIAIQLTGKVENPKSLLYIDDRESNAFAGVNQGIQGLTFIGFEKLVDWFIDHGFLEEEKTSWKLKIYNQESRIIKKFFGKKIPLKHLPTEITEERFLKWKKLGLGLHFMPEIEMTLDKQYPGWKIKPYGWFYDRIAVEDILDCDTTGQLRVVKKPANLGGKWILIDERPKPEDKNGLLYENDFLSPVMKKLRKNGTIEHNQSLNAGTRFFTSWTEFNEILKPEIAKILGVKTENVRLPRIIEYNYLGNFLHPDWGKTDTWEWLQEACGGGKYRTRGGHSFAGGLAIVYWRGAEGHGTDRGFRPVVDFEK